MKLSSSSKVAIYFLEISVAMTLVVQIVNSSVYSLSAYIRFTRTSDEHERTSKLIAYTSCTTIELTDSAAALDAAGN